VPELREVFEMTTKQIKPEVDAWREQQERQGATSRKGKVGAFAVAAAIGIGALTFAFLNRPGQEPPAPIVQPPEQSDPVDQGARGVATGFVEAVGAFDAGTAATYLAGDAALPQEPHLRGAPIARLHVRSAGLQAEAPHLSDDGAPPISAPPFGARSTTTRSGPMRSGAARTSAAIGT
jgi:hypothetical protein